MYKRNTQPTRGGGREGGREGGGEGGGIRGLERGSITHVEVVGQWLWVGSLGCKVAGLSRGVLPLDQLAAGGEVAQCGEGPGALVERNPGEGRGERKGREGGREGGRGGRGEGRNEPKVYTWLPEIVICLFCVVSHNTRKSTQ